MLERAIACGLGLLLAVSCSRDTEASDENPPTSRPAVQEEPEPEEKVAYEDLIADADITEVVVTGMGYVDGPAWSPDGYLLISDNRLNVVNLIEADGVRTEYLHYMEGPQGLAFDAAGNLYICQERKRRLVRQTADGTPEILAETYEGKKLNSPNDLVIDEHGGIYFTDPRYGPMQDMEFEGFLMAVYYLPVEGELRRVISTLERPNGIALSPDEKTLYIADTNRLSIYAFPVEGPGELGKGKLLFQGVREESGVEIDGSGPDGLAVDELGNIYACFKTVVVVSPEGERLGEIIVGERPSNVAFGGPEGKTLFITARNSLYSIDMAVRGVETKGSRP